MVGMGALIILWSGSDKRLDGQIVCRWRLRILSFLVLFAALTPATLTSMRCPAQDRVAAYAQMRHYHAREYSTKIWQDDGHLQLRVGPEAGFQDET